MAIIRSIKLSNGDEYWFGGIHYYCPTCDTPLDVCEYVSGEGDYARAYPDDEDGNDVFLDCPCCGWHAGATAHDTMCEAWEAVIGRMKQSTVLIVEPRDE